MQSMESILPYMMHTNTNNNTLNKQTLSISNSASLNLLVPYYPSQSRISRHHHHRDKSRSARC